MFIRYLITTVISVLQLNCFAYQIYTVKRGDTLIGISHKFGIKPKFIKEANPNVNWLTIKPNDKIKIPLLVLEKASSKTKSNGQRIYVIEKGDTLISIAHKLHFSVQQLKMANPKVDWLKIRPGQTIVLPNKHITIEKQTPKPGEIGDGYYVVAKGDTLRKIANRFGLTLNKLMELNPKLGRIIKPGDVVVIPKNLTEKIKLSEQERLFIPPRYLLYSEVYKVKKGDSLWSIAKKFNTDVDILRTLNDISGNNIRTGQILFVPSRNLKGVDRLKLRYSILNQERHALVKYAERFIGTPYKFGGESLKYGIDCSAFVQKVFSKFKIYLPRTAEEQYRTVGVPVPVKHLQPGDLLFFHTLHYAKVTHVAIYIGHGRFIHAAGRKSGVKISHFTRYYWKHFIGAKRVLGVGQEYAYLRNRSG